MHRTHVATDEGFDAGRRGELLEANPHAGVDEILAGYWAAGHAQGVRVRAEKLIVWPLLRPRQAPQRFAA